MFADNLVLTLSTTAAAATAAVALAGAVSKRDTKAIETTIESTTIRGRGVVVVGLGDNTVDEADTTTSSGGGGSPSSKEGVRKSAYVCEDGLLRLACSDGRRIQLLRANFGRFSITLCNPSGFLDWSVNCASGNSRAVLHERLVSFDYKFNNNSRSLALASRLPDCVLPPRP